MKVKGTVIVLVRIIQYKAINEKKTFQQITRIINNELS